MFTANCPIILASASPRRRELLQALGLQCICIPAAIDETPRSGEMPAAFAMRMAQNKAKTIAAVQAPSTCVIGADTVVSIDGRILGKPADHAEALRFLELLNGKTHTVITGYTVIARHQSLELTRHSLTRVRFGHFTGAVLKAYACSKEPLDKAGAYAIQGAGAFLPAEIEGSSTNVIGLPVQELLQILLRQRIILPRT